MKPLFQKFNVKGKKMLRPKQILKASVVGCLLALVVSSGSVWAATLQENRVSGALGETASGYVVARKPSAKADADTTNAKRKTVYAGKANAQGVSINQVGKVYAQQIIKKVPAGTWIQNSSGKWYQK